MRLLPVLLLLLASFACARNVHETRIAENDVEINVTRRDTNWSASFERAGVRYKTTDPAVVIEVQQVVEAHRQHPDAYLYSSVEQIFKRAVSAGKAQRV